MLTYDQATDRLKNRDTKKLENNTHLHRIDADTLAVQLHATDVVLIHRDGSYTLNSGGWRTVTTKDRINSYSPVRVYSDGGVWKVYRIDGGLTLTNREFTDGMVVDSSGAILKGGDVDTESIRKNLAKRIKRYIDGYAADAIEHGGLQQPSNGDCWLCLGFVPGGANDVSHIAGHLDEPYYVPSMLANAIKARGGSLPLIWSMIDREVKQGQTRWLKQVLRAYFKGITRELLAASSEACDV